MPDRILSKAFTLLEVLVVTAISLILLGVGSYTYIGCLKAYRDTQGLTQVYQTSKLIDSQLRDYLGHAVNVPGKWIMPVTSNFPGQGSAAVNAKNIDYYYLSMAG